MVKNLPADVGDVRDEGLIPGKGRSPGGRHSNPLQWVLPWGILWTEETGRHIVGHDWWDLTCRQPGPNLFVHSTYSTNICWRAILQLNRKGSGVVHTRDEQTSTIALNRRGSGVVHMRGEQTSTIAMSIADHWSSVNWNNSDNPLSSCLYLAPVCPNFPPKSPLGLTLML